MTSWPPDFRAEGRIARLEPLSPDHRAGLAEAAADGDLQALWYTSVPAPEAMPDEIGRRLALRARGSMLPLTVFEALTGRVAGMTTYMNIDAANRRVEIGSTWTRASAQRTGLNTEAKRLLLGHAFEALDCIAVEFRTHVMNRQSRAAIERLGETRRHPAGAYDPVQWHAARHRGLFDHRRRMAGGEGEPALPAAPQWGWRFRSD